MFSASQSSKAQFLDKARQAREERRELKEREPCSDLERWAWFVSADAHLPVFRRREVEDFFGATESGASKRSALSVFRIARKLLFVFNHKEDKEVRFLL